MTIRIRSAIADKKWHVIKIQLIKLTDGNLDLKFKVFFPSEIYQQVKQGILCKKSCLYFKDLYILSQPCTYHMFLLFLASTLEPTFHVCAINWKPKSSTLILTCCVKMLYCSGLFCICVCVIFCYSIMLHFQLNVLSFI